MPIKSASLLPKPRPCDRETQVLGYLRVHDTDQDPGAQLAALGNTDAVFIDATSTFRAAQPALNLLMTRASRGDICRVSSIDRLGPTLGDAIGTIKLITGIGVEIQFGDGRLICQPASFERTADEDRDMLVLGLIREADHALRAGHPSWTDTTSGVPFPFDGTVSDAPALSIDQLELAELQLEIGIPVKTVATAFNVSPATLFLATQRHGIYADYPRR